MSNAFFLYLRNNTEELIERKSQQIILIIKSEFIFFLKVIIRKPIFK